jgi:uncharacterized protein
LRIVDYADRMEGMDRQAAELIRLLQLAPLPEGGFYKETYRSTEMVPQSALPPGFSGSRPCATAIIYLLPEGRRSLLHRLKSDEVWHFYLGGPLSLCSIEPSGAVRRFTLGNRLDQGDRLQQVVPGGSWMGATPLPGTPYSLLGCTVAPGFDFADLEMGDRRELTTRFPHARDLIESFT